MLIKITANITETTWLNELAEVFMKRYNLLGMVSAN